MVKKYEKYKDSGVEWIGEIPEHWEVRKLKYSAKINLSNVDKKTLGGQVKVKLCNYVDVYKNSKITSKIEFMEATATKEQKEKFILQEGDVIITKDSESPDDIAVPAYVLESMNDVVCGYHLAHIKPRIIRGLFLYYSFLTEKLKDQFCISANGITRYGLGKDSIGGSIFFVPPLLEQEKIAAYLDKKSEAIDKFIKNKEELINLLEEERKAIITKALTKGIDSKIKFKDSRVDWLGNIPEHWELRKLSQLTFILTCGLASTPKYVDKENGIPFLSAQNVRPNRMDLRKFNYISKSLHKELTKNRKPKMGDVLITRVGAGIGDACIVDVDMEFSVYVSLTHLRTRKELLNKFIVYFFQTEYSILLNNSGTVEGGGQGNLNVQNLKRYMIPLPPLDEQQLIVVYLDEENKKIDDLKAKYRQEIGLIKEYKERLIYDVVTGKMSVLEH